MSGTLPSELAALLAARTSAERDRAWDAFLAAYGRLILHTARVIGRDHDGAMDAYAHVLGALRGEDCGRLRAYTPDGRTRFTTWLVVVARRLCFDHLRQRYGRERDAPADEERRLTRRRLMDLVAAGVDPDSLDDPRRGADETLVIKDRGDALDASLADLGAEDRLLVKLRFEDGRTARQIAAILGFPTPFHVYRRLNAVLDALRLALGRRGIRGSDG